MMDDAFAAQGGTEFGHLPNELQDMIAQMLAAVDQRNLAFTSRHMMNIVRGAVTATRNEIDRGFADVLQEVQYLLAQVEPVAPRRPRWGPAPQPQVGIAPGAANAVQAAVDDLMNRLQALEVRNQAQLPAYRLVLNANYTNQQVLRHFAAKLRGAVARMRNRGG